MEQKNVQSNQLKLELDVFEGPLDLLLHLINQLEIDIYDIPIAKITQQYLEYLDSMKTKQIDLASEYFVMAANLMRIKSEMLVPRNENQAELDEESDSEEDPRQSLVDLLVEYQQIKEVLPQFEERQIDRADFFGKEPADLSTYRENIELKNQGLDVNDLSQIFHDLLARQRLNAPQDTKITSEEITIPEKMTDILKQLMQTKDKQLSFSSLIQEFYPQEIVLNFLSVLELVKDNQVLVHQKSLTSDILISLKKQKD